MAKPREVKLICAKCGRRGGTYVGEDVPKEVKIIQAVCPNCEEYNCKLCGEKVVRENKGHVCTDKKGKPRVIKEEDFIKLNEDQVLDLLGSSGTKGIIIE
jgi:hypothetical protein